MFFLLAFPVALEGMDIPGGEGDAADCGGAGTEVEIFPVQTKKLDFVKFPMKNDFKQGMRSAGFVGGEIFKTAGTRGVGAALQE